MSKVRSFFFAALCGALVLPMPGQARIAAPQPTPALVRPGDRAMTCDALATEINSLVSAEQVAEKPKKKRGGLGLLRVLGSAAPMLSFGGGGSGLIGGVASQAAGMAQQQVAQGQMEDAMEASVAAANPRQSVEAQRRARLSEIFEDKGC